MKTKIRILFFILLLTKCLYAQDRITVEATGYDISDNLDLEAVASLFGECSNLEEFEQKLNDPEIQISNLDLNQDGYVDYIRVIETSTDETFLVTLQAVIGDNLFQDIATIDVEKDESNTPRVQITGDVYLYGDGYIIEPVFLHMPVIFDFFWGIHRSIWFSPYYWRHYPGYFRPWKPYSVARYRQNNRGHRGSNISFQYPSYRRSQAAPKLQSQTRRNDYSVIHPENSFSRRNKSIRNKQELDRNRTIKRQSLPRSGNVKSTGRTVQKNWTPTSGKNRTQGTNATRSSSPSVRQERTKSPVKPNRGSQQSRSTTQKSSIPKSVVSTSPAKSNTTNRTQQTKSTSVQRSSTRKASVNNKTTQSSPNRSKRNK